MEVGQYKIIEKIGHGGMGIVYKAVHTKIEKIVAIKALSPQLSEDPKMKERFFNEARLQAKLSHPNIVDIYNYLELSGNIYLVMEYVEGETLESRLKREGSLACSEAVELSEKVLDALSYLHSKGIVHRDLKPSNIMFSESGAVKLTDFGISKLVGKKGVTTTALAGSYIYMSPEEINGEGTTYLSDIYSFGITLYQMLTGKVPYNYDSEYKIMKAHLEEIPLQPRSLNKRIPLKLSETVLKGISKSPETRFHTPEEFKEELLESMRDRNFRELAYIKFVEKKTVASSLAFLSLFLVLSIYLFNNTKVTPSNTNAEVIGSKNTNTPEYKFDDLKLNNDDAINEIGDTIEVSANSEKKNQFKNERKPVKTVKKKVVKQNKLKGPIKVYNRREAKVIEVSGMTKESELYPQDIKKTKIKKQWKIRK